MTTEIGSIATNPAPIDLATTGAQAPRKGGRFVFVDALRGAAAMWVLLYHAVYFGYGQLILGRLPGWVETFFMSGHHGVPIFFVLSGFVIAHSVSRYRVDLPFMGRFFLRRSIRLDLPYWSSMILIVGLGLLSNLVAPTKLYTPPSLPMVAANVFYLQRILGYPTISDVYWTLSFEVQFYLVFCLLMGLAHATRRDEADKRSLFLIFVPAFLVAVIWPLGFFPTTYPIFFPPVWHGFLLGVLACWAMNGTVRPAWFYAYAAAVGIGGLWNGFGFTIVCALTSALLYFAARMGGLTRWLDWRWLQFLGLISYSLYLIHCQIITAVFKAGYIITGHSFLSECFWCAAMVVACVGCAGVMWWLVERPSLALAHHFSLHRQGPRGPAVAPDPPAMADRPAIGG